MCCCLFSLYKECVLLDMYCKTVFSVTFLTIIKYYLFCPEYFFEVSSEYYYIPLSCQFELLKINFRYRSNNFKFYMFMIKITLLKNYLIKFSIR